MRQVVVTRAAPDTTGMSALVGFIHPIGAREPAGMSISLGREGSTRVTAPLAPGVVVTVGVEEVHPLALGEKIPAGKGPCILALDGEREIPLGAADEAEVMLSPDGPWIVDIRAAMNFAVENGAFSNDKAGVLE